MLLRFVHTQTALAASMNIIFTSCMDAERIPSQPIWDHIADEEPDVLILLGDQIYMDWAKSKRPDEDDIHALTTDPARLRQFGTDMYNRYRRCGGRLRARKTKRCFADNESTP